MDELGYERMAQSFAQHRALLALRQGRARVLAALPGRPLADLRADLVHAHRLRVGEGRERRAPLALGLPRVRDRPVRTPARPLVGSRRPVAARAADALQRLRDEREPRLSALPARHVDDAARRPPAERRQRRAHARRDPPRLGCATSARRARARSTHRIRARGARAAGATEKVASPRSGERSRSTASPSGSPASRSSSAWDAPP